MSVKVVDLFELDRFTDPIPPKPVLRLRRLLHPRTSSGSIPRNQAERGITWTDHSPENAGVNAMLSVWQKIKVR